MDLKKLSRWEAFAIVFCMFVFVVLSLIVVFRSDWLDSIFYGSAPQEQEGALEPVIDRDDDVAELFGVEPYAKIEIDSEGGEALVSLSLEKEADLTGLELVFEREEALEILDFVCKEPFDCVLFDVSDSQVSILAVIPPASVETIDVGDLLVGELTYSGSGVLYLKEDTFASTTEDPGSNILDFSYSEFLLD